MTKTMEDILEFVEENDIKFVRLGFCDLLGSQKNISIMADQLMEAFENGIPFDASSIQGFNEVDQSDLLLFPDPSTLTILPWRPGPGRVIRFFCDIKQPNGSLCAQDSRQILKRVTKQCEEKGYICKIGAECEFYIFKTNDEDEPTKMPLDRGSYLDISPLDKGENIRREICLSLEEMGIQPESSHHERGPGQNEIDFTYSDALSCADNLLTFKSVVKAIAARNGYFASFMPKPIANAAGSGLHINLSLSENGFNIFRHIGTERAKPAESFIAGLINRVSEITVFLNATTNSFERPGDFEAPKYVSWSHQNRSQLIRIPAAVGERVRVELRSPDPACNPYLAFALVIAAGMEGIESNLELSKAHEVNLFNAEEAIIKELDVLPENLDQAIDLARKSTFIKRVIGEELLEKYCAIKENEAQNFSNDQYFPIL